ncbi:6-phosphogluconolactonase [Chthonobacter rhizosphaerae]|uniref:6-phosphogluconolactonase n=1 Tax=Chthonobacter rhizosphaerae TaxID=2735553 RepID=UPI0015EFD793|nr:6-phosphogluconolactonase [Chthonobacter rhizosphaerae]
MLDQRTFDSPDSLAAALSAFVGDAITDRIARDGKAAIAVSGGRTPIRFLEALSALDLDWPNVLVTLVDERWVPETSERSNGALVRRHLIRDKAALATFVPLYRETTTPDESLGLVARTLADMPLPFAAVVLGMGDDGHTASFFPGGDRLADAIDPIGGAAVAAIRAPGAGEPRITLTLPMILAADRLALHIEGTGKKAVLDEALAGEDPLAMPVRAVLKSPKPPVVFWCG